MVRTVGMEKRGQALGRCTEEALLINSLWHMRMRVEISRVPSGFLLGQHAENRKVNAIEVNKENDGVHTGTH